MGAANLKGERRAIQRTMDALLAETRHGAQLQLPSGAERAMKFAGGGASVVRGRELPAGVAELVFALQAERRLADLVLRDDLVEDVREFLDEFTRADLLYRHSLEPRHTILLVGPPGNGKTSLAEAIATELGLPVLAVRYDAIVDSYLGETSSRLRKLIDYATLNPCVLFFDEFEAVAKERSDSQETGEIKRVVSSLLLQLDRLPSHAVVVCATNHPELLDRAIWRRFELQLEVPPPGPAELMKWFKRFCDSLADAHAGRLALSGEEFAAAMAGRNMSEVEAFTLDVRRKLVLSEGRLDTAQAVRAALRRSKKRLQALRGDDGKQLPDGEVAPGGQGT